MAISLLCVKCWKSTSNLKSKKCKCGYSREVRKYKVRVKTTEGWLTGTVPSLKEARDLEQKLISKKHTQNVTTGQIPDTLQVHPVYQAVSAQDSTAPTIADIWPHYLTWAKIHKRSWDMDKSRYNNFLKDPLGKLHMDTIKPFHVQAILNKMYSNYKPASVKQVLMLVKRLFNWSIEQGLYEGKNPCKVIKIPKFDNRVTNTLSRNGLKRLEDTLETWTHNEIPVLIIRYALYSGKRKCEILNLKWSDVNLENGFVTYRNTKSGATQSLPLNKRCSDILIRAGEIKTSDYVFPSRTGTKYYYGGIDKCWRLIRKKAGISIRFHDLRHTYASYLASSGKVDIYTLKELLGHSTLEMTQRYAHLINGALQKAACVADEVF